MIWTYLLIKSTSLILKILNTLKKLKKILKWIKDLFKKLKELRFTQFTHKDLDLKYFKLSEFSSPDEPNSGFKINSGYRTQKHNALVGGRVGSSHLKGLAADIGYNGSRDRYLILNALMEVGITRFGIAKSFIHCDLDNSKDSNVIWLY